MQFWMYELRPCVTVDVEGFALCSFLCMTFGFVQFLMYEFRVCAVFDV